MAATDYLSIFVLLPFLSTTFGLDMCQVTFSMNAVSYSNVSSPNYPHPYSNGFYCMSVFTTLPSDVITISFRGMDIENSPSCSNDALLIVANCSSPKHFDPYCGSTIPASLTLTSCTTIGFVFYTNINITRSGFLLTIQTNGSHSSSPCSDGCEAKYYNSGEIQCICPHASFLTTTPPNLNLRCLFMCDFSMDPDKCRSGCTTTTNEWRSPSSTDSSTLTNYLQSSPANGRTIMDVYNNSGMAVVFAIAVAVVLAIFVVCSIAVCCMKKCHRRRLSNHSAVHIERADMTVNVYTVPSSSSISPTAPPVYSNDGSIHGDVVKPPPYSTVSESSPGTSTVNPPPYSTVNPNTLPWTHSLIDGGEAPPYSTSTQ